MAFKFNFGFMALVVLALLSVANAHMKMSSPVPFNVANLDNSPLKADGSDFPCKASLDNPSSYSISALNNLPVSSPILMSWDGSAVHGGGTCELSISLDKEPTKDSVFKVIQVFQGACPTATGGGITFDIPKEFPNTDRATLAWTWFNKIGNREMYMNCAPIAITGGSDNGQGYYDSLPDMFVANVPTSECTTEESTDPTMPNPGDFVLQDSAVKPGKVIGSCAASAPMQNENSAAGKVKNLAAYGKPAKDSNVIVPVDGSSGTGSGSGGASSAPGGAYSQPAASPAQPSSAPTATYNNGQWTQPVASPAQPTSTAVSSSAAPSVTAPASSASSAASTSTCSTLTVPASSATPPAYPTLSPTIGQGVSGPSTGSSAPTGSSSSSSGTTSSGSTGSSGQCTTEGAIFCNGSTQFGLCDHGSVVWQVVAAGTTCSNGAILKRSQPVVPRHHARGFHKVRI
ncbi:hypothetical protein Q7P35_009985 [Cladosporium inversicolor]